MGTPVQFGLRGRSNGHDDERCGGSDGRRPSWVPTASESRDFPNALSPKLDSHHDEAGAGPAGQFLFAAPSSARTQT